MLSAAKIVSMQRYLAEKTEMGMVHGVVVKYYQRDGRYRPKDWTVRISFKTFVRFYAQVILVSWEHQQLRWWFDDVWTAVHIPEGPHTSRNFPVDVGLYGVYSTRCAAEEGIPCITGELHVAWSMHASEEIVDQLRGGN